MSFSSGDFRHAVVIASAAVAALLAASFSYAIDAAELAPSHITGLRSDDGGATVLLLEFSAVKLTEDRTVAHYDIRALSGPQPQAILLIPVNNIDDSGSFAVHSFTGDGRVSTDEWNAGTFFREVVDVRPINSTLAFDVTELLQDAVNRRVPYLSFSFRIGSTRDGPPFRVGRYFLSSPPNGLAPPTISFVQTPQVSGIGPRGDNVWYALADAAQTPLSLSLPRSPRVHAAFWVDSHSEAATLTLSRSDVPQYHMLLTLRCAPAGVNGPVVWTAPATAYEYTIRSADIETVAQDTACGARINNVASLKAAAEERRLYLDFVTEGAVVRGQLWPRSLRLQEDGLALEARASDQQAANRTDAPLWKRATATFSFSEAGSSLSYMSYEVPDARSHRSVTVHCAAAGVDGDVLATLYAGRGSLTNSDLIPTQESGPCGMAVNNIASLLEAIARGRVYVRVIDSSGVEMRGQLQRP